MVSQWPQPQHVLPPLFQQQRPEHPSEHSEINLVWIPVGTEHIGDVPATCALVPICFPSRKERVRPHLPRQLAEIRQIWMCLGEPPSPLLAPSSKNKASSLGAFSSICPAPLSASEVTDLATGWSATKGRAIFQICQGESLCPGELWEEEIKKRGTTEMVLGWFCSWWPSAQRWDPPGGDLCKLMISTNPFCMSQILPQSPISITQIHPCDSNAFL